MPPPPTGSQLAVNDQRISHALLAAESGLDFMRYQLARVHIPPSTPPTQVIDSLFQNLQSQLNSTTNLHGQPIARSGNTITIPGNGNYIPLDSAGLTAFRATITDWAGEIVVKIDGRYGNNAPARAISMDFTRQPHSTTVFDYAVASKGQIVGSKGAVGSTDPAHPEIATMMSAFSSSDAVNSLNFSGNFTQSPLPAGSQFDALRATSGISILAPAANISMTGSSGGRRFC